MLSSSLCFPRTLLLLVWGGIYAGITRVVADGLNPFISPSSNQVVPVGQPFLIQWIPGTPGPVRIAIEGTTSLGAGNLTTSTPNNGSYTWIPDPVLAIDNQGQGYFLQICDINTHDCTYTFDGRFSFANSSSETSSSSSSTSTVILTISTSTNAISTISATTSAILTSSTTTSAIPTSSTNTSATPTTSTTSAAPTVPSIASSTPTSSSSPASSSKLSTGAKVAIGVVVSAVGTAALLVGGFILLRRRRKAKLAAAKRQKQGPLGPYNKPELSGDGIRQDIAEMEGPNSGNAFEMPSNGPAPVHELGTD